MNRWAIVPAAGIGRRMGEATPKQYLPLHGRTVIECTLERLAFPDLVSAIVVVLSPQDDYWPQIGLRAPVPLVRAPGGVSRHESVLNGLLALAGRAAADDWVLVHDAARPCVRVADVERLVTEVQGRAPGGLLAVPVRDTLKQTRANDLVAATVSREGLWRALTPQMFRLDALTQALREALEAGVTVTDEAQAMERAGLKPLLVCGHADNIKITTPEDLRLAELLLSEQARGG